MSQISATIDDPGSNLTVNIMLYLRHKIALTFLLQVKNEQYCTPHHYSVIFSVNF